MRLLKTRSALTAFALTLLVAATLGAGTAAQHDYDYGAVPISASVANADLALMPTVTDRGETAFDSVALGRKPASCTPDTEAGKIREWFKMLLKKIKRFVQRIVCRWVPGVGYQCRITF